MGLRLAMLTALPCALGLCLVGEPIMQLLYKQLAASPEDLAIAGQLIRIYSWAGFFLMLTYPVTGMLQGLGLHTVPVRNMAIGAVLKVVSSYLLLRIPEINIMGAAIGSVICYGASAILNIISLVRHSGIRFSFMDFIGRPLIAAAPMGVVAFFSYKLCASFLPVSMSLVVCVGLAVVVYLVMILAARALRPDDVRLLPGGSKLDYFMHRIGVWR